MATIAIDFVLDQLPRAETKPRRRRGENKGRHVSRTVRHRNRRGANPRWQPSRAFKKFKQPRAAVKAEAIAEALDRRALAPDEYWALPSDDIAEYERERSQQDAVEVEERHHVILTGIQEELSSGIDALMRRRERLTRLVTGLRRELLLADRYEAGALRPSLEEAELQLQLVENDLVVRQPYAEAA